MEGVGTLSAAGASGAVKITVVYNNGSDKTISHTVNIPGSVLPNGAQPTGPGAAFDNIYRRFFPDFYPGNLNDPTTLASWVDGVTVSITVAYIGSPRVIDLSVWEEPYALAYDTEEDTWIAPMHCTDGGGPLPTLIGTTPVTRRSDGPHGGTFAILDAAKRVSQETGPVLLYWSAWDEASQSVTATETDYKFVNSTTQLSLVNPVHWHVNGHNAAHPGFSISSGANARRVQDSEQHVVLRDVDNVVPVRCYVYCAMSTGTGPTGSFRFWTAPYSMCEVAVPTGTTWAWRSAPGHLKCGLGAQDLTQLQITGAVSTTTGSPELRWRYIMVVYDGSI